MSCSGSKDFSTAYMQLISEGSPFLLYQKANKNDNVIYQHQENMSNKKVLLNLVLSIQDMN